MAINNFLTHPQPGSDAVYRSTGLAISNGLTAVGLLQTADTGQVNWTTVTRNNSNVTPPHYEIRLFSDSVGNPIYFRINYGTATSGQLMIQIIVGNGSDGNGNITGNTYTLPILCLANGGSTTYPSFVSSDGGYLTIGLCLSNLNTTSAPQKISLGRTRDRNGNATSDGLDIAWCGTNFSAFSTNDTTVANRGHVFLPKNGSGLARSVGPYHSCLPPTGTGQSGDIEGRFPLYVTRGGPDYPSMSAIVFILPDFGGANGVGSVISFEYYGVDHSYLHCGSPYGTSAVQGNTSAVTLALRYE